MTGRTLVTARAWLRREIGHDVEVGEAGALVACPVAEPLDAITEAPKIPTSIG